MPTGSRHDTAAARRYRQRARKLTPDQEATIRPLAASKSLRSLAAVFGVSHETVRAVLNTRATADTDGAERVTAD